MVSLPKEVKKSDAYKQSTPCQVLEAIQFFNIGSKEVILFWLARFYVTCPLPPLWSKRAGDQYIDVPTFVNIQHKVEIPVHPCLFFVNAQISNLRALEKEEGNASLVEQRHAGRRMKFYDKLYRKYEIDMSSYVMTNLSILNDKVCTYIKFYCVL